MIGRIASCLGITIMLAFTVGSRQVHTWREAQVADVVALAGAAIPCAGGEVGGWVPPASTTRLLDDTSTTDGLMLAVRIVEDREAAGCNEAGEFAAFMLKACAQHDTRKVPWYSPGLAILRVVEMWKGSDARVRIEGFMDERCGSA